MNITAILTDIEGTTTSISFVHDVLFPYASTAMHEFLRSTKDDSLVSKLLDEVRALAKEPDASRPRLGDILCQWISEDRKVTPLKALQGLMWERGYKNGDLRAHVYADVPDQLAAWSQQGIALYVYSSGSVQAQQLLFRYSELGDLSGCFKGYFDTKIGLKQAVSSYQYIAQELAVPASQILFLSDVLEELQAAAEAGMNVIQLVRDSNVKTGPFQVVASFAQIDLASAAMRR